MKKFIMSLVILSHLTACASKSDNISSQYVSPLIYQQHNCNQIRMEMARVGRRVNEVAGVQDDMAGKDAAALGVGLVIFWPALFFMIGSDKKEEIARLKGEYEALEQVAIQKECDISVQIAEQRRLREEREAEKKKQQKEFGQPNQ